MPGIQSFVILRHSVMAKLATSSIKVKYVEAHLVGQVEVTLLSRC